MTMAITDEQLCAYLDGELDDAGLAAVERALAQDEALKAKLAGWSVQAAGLRATLATELDEPVPQTLLRLALEPQARPVSSRRAQVSWARRLRNWLPSPRFAAGMAVAVLFGIFVGRHLIPMLDMDGQLVRLASVAHHVYSPDKRQPVEVKGEDPTLVSWISKRLGAKVTAPQVAGYKFLGGRLLAGAEEPAAQFMYEDASGRRLTVFVRTEGAAGRSTSPECSAYRGVSVCYWYAGGVAYALSGEVPESTLSLLAGPAAQSMPSVH